MFFRAPSISWKRAPWTHKTFKNSCFSEFWLSKRKSSDSKRIQHQSLYLHAVWNQDLGKRVQPFQFSGFQHRGIRGDIYRNATHMAGSIQSQSHEPELSCHDRVDSRIKQENLCLVNQSLQTRICFRSRLDAGGDNGTDWFMRIFLEWRLLVTLFSEFLQKLNSITRSTSIWKKYVLEIFIVSQIGNFLFCIFYAAVSFISPKSET